MTEKLFYKDAYMTEFDSVVTDVKEVDGKYWAAFEQSAFYPEGGGQPADSGEIVLNDGSLIQVFDVREESSEGDIIWHLLSAPVAKSTEIHGKINWERRFDHMQQHSGEHIVSGLICSRFNCDNVGFHMGEDVITIDYSAKISYEEALEVEAAANRYIWENHAFVEKWPTAEELKGIDYRSKKELQGAVRITSFPGADTCACCGTHVKSSSEVGLVKFISAKNFHEGSRLELFCGKRAMDFLAMNYQSNKAVAVLLSTKEEKCPELVKKLIEEKVQLKNSLTSLENKYLKMWAQTFKGQENVLVIDDELEGDQGRVLADLIADECSGMTAVMVKSGDAYRYSIIKRGTDISGFIKEMNQSLNGRGGGRDGFAQGTVKAEKEAVEAFFTDKFNNA